MRYLIISDIHANLAALNAVLEDAKGGWDMIWCLGDLVGYGPDPNECIARLREYKHLSLSGNHDWAVLGRLDLDTFNDVAREAVEWTKGALSEENRAYLDELPSAIPKAPFTLAHASPRHPVWEYILDEVVASDNFEYFDTPFCLVGHTHSPIAFAETIDGRAAARNPVNAEPFELNATRMIINPGSVGQPRDFDSRAAYAFLDTDKMTWEYRRVAYPIRETQERMAAIGLPFRLISRLEFGW